MSKNIFVSYRNGKISYLLMILGVIGIVFEYSVLHSHFIAYAGGDTVALTYVVLGTLALASGVLAIILAVFKITRWTWIILSSLIIVFTIIPPAVFGVALGFFPYFYDYIFSIPWVFMAGLPINPAIDFIGFWMAIGGSLLSLISSIFVPKK